MNNLGLVTERFTMADDNDGEQVTVMAAVFADLYIEIEGDSNMAGAMVGTKFDFDKNSSAHITQVPSVATNLPPGMPGAGGTPLLVVLGGPVLSNWYQSR